MDLNSVSENKEHVSDTQKSTDTHWMFTKDIFPPIEILEISQPLNQKKFQTLIYSLEDFLVRHSQSLEKGKDLPIQEVHCFSTLQELLKLKDLALFSLKTLRATQSRQRENFLRHHPYASVIGV